MRKMNVTLHEFIKHKMQQEIDEQKAYIERLREECAKLIDITYSGVMTPEDRDRLVLTINETPSQSLNHIKAQVEAETILRCKEFMELNGDDADLTQIPRLYKAE